jgi:hypothetical protein
VNSELFTSFAESVPGATFARFHLSTAGGTAPTGWSADGEVEDYIVTIKPVDALDLTDRLESTTRTFWACDEIRAGDPVDVFQLLGTADITFLAGNSAVLRDGTQVDETGAFTIELGSVPGCP